TTYYANQLQPGTTCAKLTGLDELKQRGLSFAELYTQYREEFDLPDTFIWSSYIPDTTGIQMFAGTRVPSNLADATALTASEIEGRRQIRAMMDMIRKYGQGVNPVLLSLPSRIGVRETRHVRCQHQIQG